MKKQETEIWKSVKGYEGVYEVSSIGRVRSLPRKTKHPRSGTLTLKGKVMKTAESGAGYPTVQFYKNGIPKMLSVHRLVCAAFHNNPENKEQVNHKNGIKNDNRVENLEWCTKSENGIHSAETGLSQVGDSHYKSVLTKDKVKAVKRLLRMKPKVNRYKLAEKIGVTNGVIYQIINQTTWKHIKI